MPKCWCHLPQPSSNTRRAARRKPAELALFDSKMHVMTMDSIACGLVSKRFQLMNSPRQEMRLTQYERFLGGHKRLSPYATPLAKHRHLR